MAPDRGQTLNLGPFLIWSQTLSLDIIIQYGLTFLIAFCPLAFGAVHIQAFSIMEIVVFGLCWAWSLSRLVALVKGGTMASTTRSATSGVRQGADVPWRRDVPQAISLWQTPLTYFLLPFLGLIILQLVLLPSKLVQMISPQTIHLYQETLGQVPTWLSLSMSRYLTKIDLLKFLAYLCMFFLVTQWATTKERMQRLILTLMLVAAFDALYGILEYLGGHNHILWFKKLWYLESVTGTYFNRNHFAGLLEMAIPMSFGLFMAVIGQEKRKNVSARKAMSLREVILSLNIDDHNQAKKILLLFLMAVMTLGLILSGSRGGILSLTVAFLVMGLLLSSRQRFRKYALTLLVVALLALGYGLYTGLNTTIERFGQMNVDAKTRIRFATTSLNILKDFPVLGTGWGTFVESYRRYQTPLDDGLLLDHAHHDWIELGATTGLLGLGLAVIGLLVALIYLSLLWKQRKNSFSVGLGLGGIGAIISLSLHSFTDFNMHIPANAMLFSLVIAITLVALRSRHHHHEHQSHEKRPQPQPDQHLYQPVHKQPPDPDGYQPPVQPQQQNPKQPQVDPQPYRQHHSTHHYKRMSEGQMRQYKQTRLAAWLGWPAVLACLGLFGYLLVTVAKVYLAEKSAPTMLNSTFKTASPSLKAVCRAIEYEPGKAEYYYLLAGLLEEKTSLGQDEETHLIWLLASPAISEGSAAAARESRPTPGGAVAAAAGSAASAGRDDLILLALKKAIQLKPLDPFYHLRLGWYWVNRMPTTLIYAEEEFQRAFYCMPNSWYVNFSVGSYWLWKSKLVAEEEAYQEANRAFIRHFQRVLQINPGYQGKIQAAIAEYYPVKEIQIALLAQCRLEPGHRQQ